MADLTLVIGNKNYSSWSMRPWVLMRQLGIAFDEVRLPFHSREWDAAIERWSPSRLVPVLWRDDAVGVGLARDHGNAARVVSRQRRLAARSARARARALGGGRDARGLPQPARAHADEHPRVAIPARA